MGLRFRFDWICNKYVVVKLGTSSCYVDLNIAVQNIGNLPNFSCIKHPVTSFVALYVLTGCDYVSSFFRVSKSTFLELFINNAVYICGEMVQFHNNSFDSIVEESCLRLFCLPYLFKHASVMNDKNVVMIHLLINL